MAESHKMKLGDMHSDVLHGEAVRLGPELGINMTTKLLYLLPNLMCSL